MADPRAVRAVLAGMLLVPLVACGGTAPQGQKPEKPADFSLSALSAFCVDLHDAGVQLTWSAVAGAVSYVLQRDHLELATLGADAVSCTDATVQAGETHTYVLRAVNAIGLSLRLPSWSLFRSRSVAWRDPP